MNNWYSKKIHKKANALAKSLGLDPNDEYFKLIQKNESKLKQDGSWQKLMSTKRKEGLGKALDLLGEIFSEYVMDTEKNPPQKVHSDIEHLGRSLTGGDWFLFDNPGDLVDPSKINIFETDEYEQSHESAYEEVFEEYRDFAHTKIDEKLDEISTMKERLKEDRNVLSEKEFSNKLVDYEAEEDELEGLKEKLTSYPDLGELSNILSELGYDEDLDDVVTDKAYEMAQEHLNTNGFQDALEALGSITCSGRWCISPGGSHIEGFITDDTDAIVLRRNGEPRFAITFHDSVIQEIRGVANKFSNLNTYDILDLMNCPMFDLDEILQSLEDQGDGMENFDIFNKFFEISNNDIKRNKNLIKALKYAEDIIAKAINFTYENNGSMSILDDIAGLLYDNNQDDNSVAYKILYDCIKENIIKLSNDNPVDFLDNLLELYDGSYDDEYKMLFRELPDQHLMIWFSNYSDAINSHKFDPEIDGAIYEESLEKMKDLFGVERINKFLSLISDEHFHTFTGLNLPLVTKMINDKSYTDIDISKFIQNKEYLHYYMETILNQIKYFLNNVYQDPLGSEISEGMKFISNSIDFIEYLSQLDPSFNDLRQTFIVQISERVILFVRGIYRQYDNCSKIEERTEELRKNGLDGRILNIVYERFKARGCFDNSNPEAPLLVEGLPEAPDNNMQPQQLPEARASNWYKNEKPIRNNHKQQKQI